MYFKHQMDKKYEQTTLNIRKEAKKLASSFLKRGFIKHTVHKSSFSEQCYYTAVDQHALGLWGLWVVGWNFDLSGDGVSRVLMICWAFIISVSFFFYFLVYFIIFDCFCLNVLLFNGCIFYQDFLT